MRRALTQTAAGAAARVEHADLRAMTASQIGRSEFYTMNAPPAAPTSWGWLGIAHPAN
jgi:hypothetical protein